MPLGSFYSLNSELLFLESYNSGLGMDPKSHWGCLLLVRKSLPEHLPPCSWRPGPHISIISASPSPLASTVSQWPNSAYSSPLPWPLPSPRLLFCRAQVFLTSSPVCPPDSSSPTMSHTVIPCTCPTHMGLKEGRAEEADGRVELGPSGLFESLILWQSRYWN